MYNIETIYVEIAVTQDYECLENIAFDKHIVTSRSATRLNKPFTLITDYPWPASHLRKYEYVINISQEMTKFYDADEHIPWGEYYKCYHVHDLLETPYVDPIVYTDQHKKLVERGFASMRLIEYIIRHRPYNYLVHRKWKYPHYDIGEACYLAKYFRKRDSEMKYNFIDHLNGLSLKYETQALNYNPCEYNYFDFKKAISEGKHMNWCFHPDLYSLIDSQGNAYEAFTDGVKYYLTSWGSILTRNFFRKSHVNQHDILMLHPPRTYGCVFLTVEKMMYFYNHRTTKLISLLFVPANDLYVRCLETLREYGLFLSEKFEGQVMMSSGFGLRYVYYMISNLDFNEKEIIFDKKVRSILERQ
jgi:hypothetical protein